MKSRKKPHARLPRRARLSRLEHLELSRALHCELLEDRRLLSITYGLTDVLQAYNTGVGAVGNVATAASAVDQVLGTGTLPLANQKLDQALGIAADFLKPFQPTLNQSASDWNSVAQQLQTAGFTIPVAFTGTPDANNNLLEVAWTQTLSPSDPIQIVGKTGFSYLDGGGGGLYGGITGSGSVTVSLTFGVDVNPTTQSLSFFIAPGNAIQSSLSGSTAANGLSGTIAIGDLSSVNVTATASINFTGTLGLQATASETDGKLRAGDLTNNLSQVVTGGVNGSASINAALSAQLFGLPNVNWTGTLTDAVTNNAIQSPVVNLQEPSASSLLGSLGSSLFSLGNDVPILGPLTNTINQPLPLIGKSIGQLTGLDNHLPSLPSLPSGFTNLDGSYPLAGGTLTVNVTPTTIDQFLRGQQVSLVSWQASGDVTLANDNLTIPIFSLGVPDIASLDIDATFGIHASLHYDVGFGLDGHGFYALAGTPTDPTLGLSFGVTAGLEGQVEVFGIPLAQAGGDLGFSVTPYVTLVAAPASVDPATDPSKVYFSDLALFGKDPASDLLDDTGAGIAGDFTGDVYAKINLLFFSLGFNWGISIPVFNYERSPTWPGPTGSGPGVTPWPNVTQNGGVVTFNGTAADDNVTLTQGSNGSLTVAWAGQGSETFNNVTSFVFNGGSGNDTLTAASGLDTPVRAVGGSGNDDFNLSNNAANNTLIAGTGQNTLAGGSGTDLLIGGSSSNVITVGSGPAIVYGGSGNATITLGSGKDAFYGGAGNYNIQGGSGTYTIDGGSGTDVINAGSGLNDIIYGGSAGHNQITGSSAGYTTIYGGGPGDTLVGLGGHDTLYGSAGPQPGSMTNNVIIGGPLGGNLIFGGGGGDNLAGGGNNTLYAGTGNETLAGGDGLDLVVNPSGNGLINSAGDVKSSGSNLLIAGSGNDTLFGDSTGHNTLQGGPGNDTLYAGSGGDALIAGPGTDALYGSVGNDTFQLPFTPPGQTQPNDTLVGGGGSDTLMVKAESGTGTAGLDVTADAIADATATSVTVSNGSPVAADLPANGSGLVIQIGSEQMLVTKVSGNTLTVKRGYNSTTAAPHGNNALVVLPGTVPALPAPSDYELYLNQGGTADSYAATLSTLRFATTTAGSTRVTGIDSTSGLAVGDTVTGPGIAAGTTIATIASNTSITLSTPATLSQGDLPLTFGVVGTLSFTLPGNIANIQLEGGPGNNWINVDPSVTRDVTLYGGPGNYNVLMAGSGNDALIAGPGTAVLYGGAGQDTFYAGDLPNQDVAPASGTDPALTVTNNANNPVDGNDTVIAGTGNDELFAGSGNDLLIGGSVARIVDPVTGTPGVALLQNGQYQLVEGAGRDLLVGGTGNDVLIAGPGGPGAILEGGTGNNTLIAQNYGINTFSGGKGAGHTLILGGNLENTEISNSAANRGNTLVGGLGVDNITAGAGNDLLYASYNAAAWSQGEAAAAAMGVHVVPPQFFQGDANSQQLQTLLEEEQAGTLPANQRVVLGNLFLDELDTLQSEEDNVTSQVKDYLSLLNQSFDVNPALSALLNAVDQQDQLVLNELSTLIGNIQNFIAGSAFQPDVMSVEAGGAGNDTFYGNIQGATQMVGGSGQNVFYNYNPSDTLQGGSGGDNTLVLQGDGSMTLSQDTNNVNAVDFTVNGGQPLVVGDTGDTSNIQTLQVQTGSGNDTVTVNLATLPPGSPAPGLTGLAVLCGSGNDVVDASAFTGNETITAGSGNDVIKVGATIGAGSQLTGTPTSELDLEDITSLPITVNHTSGLEVGSFTEPVSKLGTFGKLVVVGGTGTDSFTTDGSIPNVILEGGSGSGTSNTFNVSGGTATLIGGSGATNNFYVTGPGSYDIIGGTPTVAMPARATSGVAAPAPSGMTKAFGEVTSDIDFRDVATSAATKAVLFGLTPSGPATPIAYIYDANTGQWLATGPLGGSMQASATTVGTQAIFAGGENVGADVNIYNATTGQWSSGTYPQLPAPIDIAATTVGSMAIFAGGFNYTSHAPLNDVDIYHALTGQWSHTTMPEAGEQFAATSVGTKAFFAGGDTNLIQIYDTSTGAWSTYTLPTTMSFMAATTVENKAIFATTSSDAVYIYDDATGEWSTTTLPQTLEALIQATAVGNEAIFSGAVSNSGSNASIAEIYDANTGRWSTAGMWAPNDEIKTFAATSVANQALFFGQGAGANIFSFPTAVSNITYAGTTGGATTINYMLTGTASNASASIQAEYSVDGGPWQNATEATGGDGTSNLTVSAPGTAHTFVWNSGQDLGTTDNPSVQVRITPTDSIGTGITEASAPFSVSNSSVTNSLTIDFSSDTSNDTVTLTQSGNTISFNGSLAGGSQNLLGTAANLTFLTVDGGTGKNSINASGVQMPVNLNGGAGSGADTLIGGSGSDTLYYSGVGSTYDGGGGADNVLNYPASAGDLIAFGAGELLVNDQPRPIGSFTKIQNFFASGSPASLNNGTQFFVPVDDIPLTNVAITGVTATAGSPAVMLAGSFTDPYPNVTAGTDTATINWGDGTTSAATITGSAGSFTVSASHIYATNGLWTIALTVIDPAGSAASIGYSFAGGLTLDASGKLNAYSSAMAFTQVATGVDSYAVRNADGTVFVLSTTGALSSIPSNGPGTQFPGTYQSIAVGPDNYLYALQTNGDLESLPLGSSSLQFVENDVQAIVADTSGDLYKLYTSASLSVMPAGSTTWSSLLANVKSVTPSGAGIDVLTNAGVEWRYVGTAGTLIAGPHLALSVSGTATAGQSVTATLSVLDVNNDPVLGYTGTVNLSDSDGAAAAAGDGPPPPHKFSAADNGIISFPVTFLTSGSQTLTVVSNDGLTASASVAVNASAATQFSVDPPPVPVGTPIPITAASWTSDVVTVTTAPVTGGFSVGDTLTISGMTPAGYNGTITVASAQNGTQSSQFTYLLTIDPGAATGLGSVTPQATLTVTAYDAYGNVATGYSGPVTLTPVDSSAATALTSTADNGAVQFTETFNQPGGQKLIATGGSLHGNGAIVVTPAPTDLSQSAVSVTPEGVAANGQILVTLTARDALGNAETNGGLNVAFGLGVGSVGGGTFGATTDNHNGTYTALFTAGPYAGVDNITATIGGVAVTSSPASLVVTPAITSADKATFTVGTDGSFGIAQIGTAAPVYSANGKLPTGVNFDNSTGTLSGTPAAGSGGVYNLVLGAATTSGPAGTQNFTLVVDQPPTITSASSTKFVAYTTGSFAVTTASGTFPAPTFSETGALPAGVTLSPSGVLSGIPAAGSDGNWSITIDASNGVSPDTSQQFTLVVDQPAAITSAAATAFTVGAAGTFNVTTSGFPTPAFNVTGTLPTGVTVTDNHDGTATVATTAATPAGVYPFTIDAGNGASPDATQAFTLTVQQASPIINWSKPAEITYGTALGAAQLDATATVSGNTVSGTCNYTLADGTPVAAGYLLHAGQNQVLNVTFTPTDSTDYATETRQVEINVNPAPLTITAAGKSKVYGAALPALSASYSGFVNGDTAASLTTAPTLSTTAAAGSHVAGSPYTITASGAVDSDYTISYVTGSLTVTPATLTVQANDAAKFQGTPNPIFTGTIVGFVNGDNANVLSGAPSLTTSATTTSALGSYPIIAALGTLSAADYRFTFESGNLAVKPAPLTAGTASVTTGTEGVAMSTLTATFSDANTAAPTSDFSGTINWGDGTTASPDITPFTSSAVSGSGGNFTVTDTHLYAEQGSFAVTITADAVDGSTVTLNATATVAASIQPGIPVTAVEDEPVAQPVALFTEQFGQFGVGYAATATIDWGDGHTDTLPIAVVAGAQMPVAGNHTYAEEGNYTVTAVVDDYLGKISTFSSSATVSEAPIVGTDATLRGTAGKAGSGSVVTFKHGQGDEPAGSFAATIAWGDGSVSAGTVSEANGTYTVTGSHTYAAPGTFAVETTVVEEGVSTPIGGSAVIASATPFASSDAVYTIGSGTVSVSGADGLLKNDTGPTQLSVTAGTVTGAQGGTFAIHADGSFTYTPPANFPGYDSVQFTVTDASGDKATQTVTVLSQHASVVWKFYESVLNRTPDPGGLQYWTNYFDNGGSTGDMAFGFFESDELLDKVLGNYYEQYLLRPLDDSGLTYWKGVWHATGGPEQIKAGFADGSEFYKSSGGTPDSWIDALYQRILNRSPDPQGKQFWLNYYQQQQAAGVPEETIRYTIALGFFDSPEAYGGYVTHWFEQYLFRDPTDAEKEQYVNQMLGGASDRTIEQEITNLTEYANNPQTPADGSAAPLLDYKTLEVEATGTTPSSSAQSQAAVAAAKDAFFSRL